MPVNRWGTYSAFDQEGNRDTFTDLPQVQRAKKTVTGVVNRIKGFGKRPAGQLHDETGITNMETLQKPGSSTGATTLTKQIEQRGKSNSRVIADKVKRKPQVSIGRETTPDPSAPRLQGQSKRGTGKILLSNDGITGNLSQWKKNEAANRQKARQSVGSGKGIHRVGTMDVQFDDSVSDESRRAFMQDPVRPTAQINRGPRPHPMEGDGSMRSPREEVQDDISFDSFGDMIVKANELKAEKMQTDIQRTKDETALEEAKLDIERANTNIYGESTAGLNRQRDASADRDQAEARVLGHVNEMRLQLMEEKDPQKRAELAKNIQQLMGKASGDRTDLTESQRLGAINDVRKRYDEYKKTTRKKDQVPWEQYVQEHASELIPLLQGAGGDPAGVERATSKAPPGAEEEARNNPELADQFEAKYGYRP